ncbi:hypothetical protein HDIA_0162 [Hartmannibacter diazotrophicus]|uniref:HNH endonuclease n=1 Tax=Hartmannibacter diazotrophicus TaxID=1482074 RepID=A0A2C9D0F6_9HYPH|nr:hypothetical protein [Hartmannibacter diazotrophicus]SON53703.1 hypothetical protein HDIA_0162 [Hartmannibacter diazotrophicus]
MNEKTEMRNTGEREVVRVPLRPGEDRHATIYREDYERLLRNGVGTHWFVSKAGGREYVRAYCRGATGDQITVARAVLGVGRRANVSYVTKDRTDLRRGNLRAVKGNGRRNDTALCRASLDGAVKVPKRGAMGAMGGQERVEALR